MKKLLIVVIILINAILSSCTNNTRFYNVNLIGEINTLYEPIKEKYEYKEEIEIKIQKLSDLDTYLFINDDELIKEEKEFYNSYKFIMPNYDVNLYITHNPYEYRKDLTLLNVTYKHNKIKKEDIIKVKLEEGIEGVSPTNLVNIKYSKDKKDINNVFNMLNKEIELDKTFVSISGGNYKKYTIFLNDNYYEFLIENNYIFIDDFSSYYVLKFKDKKYNTPKLYNPEIDCFAFNVNSLSFSLYTMENDKYLEFNNVNMLEFIKTSNIYGLEKRYYLNIYGLKVYIYNEIIISIDNVFYEIISNYNFSFLFNE